MNSKPAPDAPVAQANIDPQEIRKFESLAHRWWDPDGDFRPLHDINEVRMKFIADRAELKGQDVIEVGCGGGILTESLAKLGAVTTGVDPASGPLNVARIHAVESGLQDHIRYLNKTAEEIVEEEAESYDVVAALEMLEHVPDYTQTIDVLSRLARPGGHVFLSTLNRHVVAYLIAVLGGEYVLNVLPRGTHDYKKFIKPAEISRACRQAGLVVKELTGYRYNPFTRTTALSRNVYVNYIVHAIKPS